MKKMLFITFGKSPLDETQQYGVPKSILTSLIDKYEIDVFVVNKYCSLRAVAGSFFGRICGKKNNLLCFSEIIKVFFHIFFNSIFTFEYFTIIIY